jgi:hypothetical protein
MKLSLVARESAATGVNSAVSKLLLDAQQLVVLSNALRSSWGTSFDLSGVGGNR